MHIGWAVVLDRGGVGRDGRTSSQETCEALLARGIVPIVRNYRGVPNPGRLSQDELAAVKVLIRAGVRYFQPNNEPNLPGEWKDGHWVPGGNPEAVMVDWVEDALAICYQGGIPLFPPLAPCGHHKESGSIPWHSRAIAWLKQNRFTEMGLLINEGLGLAVHDYALNHWYRDEKGVWHFEYPNDPIAQAREPGVTVMDYDNGVTGWRALDNLFSKTFGVHVPILATEGGIPPKKDWYQEDAGYPGYGDKEQAEGTVAMYNWVELQTPPWYFCLASWLLCDRAAGGKGDWEENAWVQKDRTLPVVEAMKVAPPAPPAQGQPTVPVETPDAISRGVRLRSWESRGVQFNPGAALYKKAQTENLGAPLGPEKEAKLSGSGKTILWQEYALGIVWCFYGDWENVEVVKW